MYYGDETRWWYGVVNDVSSDPLEVGRARVRIYGIHGPDINDEDLPWASVLLPTTSGGVSGLGTSPWLQVGARVMGIFFDGKGSQNPVILGSIPAIEGAMPTYDIDPSRSGTGNGISDVGGRRPAVTSTTSFHGSDSEAEEAIAGGFRRLSEEEFDTLISLVYAEASSNQVERAWIAGVIINRARNKNATIMQIANAPSQFQAVTGARYNNYQPSTNYVLGPNGKNRDNIYGGLKEYLSEVPRNVFYFDSNIPGAWGGLGTGKMQKIAEDRTNAGLTLKVVGNSRFWIGGRYS